MTDTGFGEQSPAANDGSFDSDDLPPPVHLFNDPDLADFEESSKRWKAIERYSRVVPPSVTGARMLMFLQPVIVFLAPFAGILFSAGPQDADPATAAPPTTVAAEGAARSGGGGMMFLGFLGALVLLIAIPLLATRLGKLSNAARTATYLIEGVLLVGSLAVLVSSFSRPVFLATALAIGGSSAGIMALLSSQPSRRAFSEAIVGDSSERFDVRNLPVLDR